MNTHILTVDDFFTFEILQDLSYALTIAGADPLDLSKGIYTLPTADFINGIERRISQLAAQTPHLDLPAAKTWQGGADDAAWLNYNDVNRWFASLKTIVGGN
ncbi:MAG: hypothetical protein FWE21_10105 [Defluviitaleaceae bacterium]|nr:hypothetical protein [Defluviitaleaceae bacterium]